MQDSKIVVNSSSIGFCGLLAILFIGLKLTGHIAWSWWWVFAPLWGPLALVLAVLGLLGVACLVLGVLEKLMLEKLASRLKKVASRR